MGRKMSTITESLIHKFLMILQTIMADIERKKYSMIEQAYIGCILNIFNKKKLSSCSRLPPLFCPQ